MALLPHQVKIMADRWHWTKEFGQLCQLVANTIGEAEESSIRTDVQTKFYEILIDRKFSPNTPTWINAGRDIRGSLSACFVYNIEDTMESILDSSRWMGMVQKFGGGCIGGESIVLTNHGPQQLKDIVENKNPEVQVLSYDTKTQQTNYEKVTGWHTMPTSGEKVYEIAFRNNKGHIQNKMRASDHHPFFVFDGDEIKEVRADQLKPGMAVIGSTQKPGNDVDYYSWLLGYITGDGAIDKQNQGTSDRVRVVDNNEKAILRMTCWTKGSYQKSTDQRYKIPMWESAIYGWKAEKISKEFDEGVNCYTKHVPLSIWKGTPEQKFCFLVGYLDADGWYEKKKQRFEIFTVSQRLAYDIMALAGSLGIHSTLRNRPSRKENESDGYEVHFFRNQNLTDAVSLFSTKYDSQEVNWTKGIIRLSHKFKEILREKGIDTYTKAAWRNGIMIGRRLTSLSYWLQHGYASRETAANILYVCGLPELANAISSCQIVDSVECTGKDEVLYDLTVPKTQTYLASSPGIGAFVVVHNTGFDLSQLRARGTSIKSTHGKACGPIAVLKSLAATSQMVTQGGVRDGANMAVLSVYHPDVMDFITLKARESKFMLEIPREYAQIKIDRGEWTIEQGNDYIEYCRLNGLFQLFNVSIAVDKKFMNAILYYNGQGDMGPDYKAAPWMEELPCGRPICQVWDAIVDQAWASGDPGILFLDRAQEIAACHSPLEIRATNPCVSSDSWVMTKDGARQVSDLIGKSFGAIVDGKVYQSTPSGFFATGKKQLYRVKTKEGMEFRATSYHPVQILTDQSKVFANKEVAALQVGDKIRLSNHGDFTFPGDSRFNKEHGYLIGALIGDGYLNRTTNKACLGVWGDTLGAKSIRAKIESALTTLNHRSDFAGFAKIKDREEYRVQSVPLLSLALELGMTLDSKTITSTIEKQSSEFQKALLQGLFDADGCVADVEKRRVWIQLSSSEYTMLQSAQRMLVRFGIPSRIYSIRKAGSKLLPDGKGGNKEYPTKEQFDLRISKQALHWFKDRIGFADVDKQTKLIACLQKYNKGSYKTNFYVRVESIETDGEEEVFDCTIPGIHLFDLNGMVSRNCGEQYLPHNGSCNLGSIDLSKFVKPEWIARGESLSLDAVCNLIDWEEFKRVIHLSVRFLDNVVEVNHHADPGIDKVNKAERRIGLGVMGWADMLFKFGIAYDSNEAIRIGELVADFFQTEAHQASINLASEKGAFPLYEEVKGCKLSDGSVPMPLAPRRNATVTTVAPTGTISLVAGCSSGIEPHFLMAYVHKGLKESGGLGLIWASETLENEYNAFAKRSGTIGILTSLERFEQEARSCGWKPANEIPIEWHIQHQKMWQRYIDNSISKTLNLPNSATKQDVARAYLLAYSSGCKGSTVYRDGCKPEQPLNSPQNSKKLDTESVLRELGTSPVQVEIAHVLEHQVPKKSRRPRWVTSETAKVETAEGDLYVTITHDDRGMPFEVFSQLGKGGTSTAAGVEAMNRTISVGLRYGISPYEYIRQLRGIKSVQHGIGPNAIFSIPDAIGQVLEEYMVRTFGEDWAADEGWTSTIRETEPPPPSLSAETLPSNQPAQEVCPKCGAQLYHVEGCRGGTCFACGYSKCS